jgi:hypothetical protein
MQVVWIGVSIFVLVWCIRIDAMSEYMRITCSGYVIPLIDCISLPWLFVTCLFLFLWGVVVWPSEGISLMMVYGLAHVIGMHIARREAQNNEPVDLP